MIIQYKNSDKLIFPNIPEKKPTPKPPTLTQNIPKKKPTPKPPIPAQKAWIRDSKGNYVRETL